MTSFTRTWDSAYEDAPPDSQDAKLGATRIRDLKEDVRERLEVDHDWSAGTTANAGYHKKVTIVEGADPTAVADATILYAKDVSGVTEAFFRDSAGNIIQLTRGGIVRADPPGVVKQFAGTGSGAGAIPAGYLECNGQAVSRTTYAALFAVIGTTFGVGDGSTTFNVPDIAGRVIAGKEAVATRLTAAASGVNGAAVGAAGGNQLLHAHQHTGTTGNDSPDHVHGFASGTQSAMVTNGTPVYPGGAAVFAGATGYVPNTDGASARHTHSFTSDVTGSGASQNVQPTIVLYHIIAY